MTATRISVARIVRLRLRIAWQEAVEVARVASTLSDARGMPLTLANTLISSAGTVELAWSDATPAGPSLSTAQLLRALLDGQEAPAELRTFLDSADDALLGFPSERDGAPAPRFNLYWFVGPNPDVPIARLARRALAAEAAGQLVEEKDAVLSSRAAPSA